MLKTVTLIWNLFAQALEKIAFGQRGIEKTGLRGTEPISNNERMKKNTNSITQAEPPSDPFFDWGDDFAGSHSNGCFLVLE